jgi:hypothetical protein
MRTLRAIRKLTSLQEPLLVKDRQSVGYQQTRFEQMKKAQTHKIFSAALLFTLPEMIRVDKLSQYFRDAVSEKPGTGVMLVTDDGAPLASSDDSEESQTIGAAAASIFLEYKATDKFSYPPLTSFVYSAKNRTVMCKYLASLSDGINVLICAHASEETSVESLDALLASQAANLDYLVPVFAGMSRKVID